MLASKAVLWDKDGTLLDTFGSWVAVERKLAKAIATEFGFSYFMEQDYIQRVLVRLGVKPDGSVASHGPLASGTSEAIINEFYIAFCEMDSFISVKKQRFFDLAKSKLSAILEHDPIIPIPAQGSQEILNFFKKLGLYQGLATSDSLVNTKRDMATVGFLDYFTFIATSDTVEMPKPHPYSVYAFANSCNITPAEILVIGDTPADEAMAIAAGASFVAVLSGTGTVQDFSPKTHMIQNLFELSYYLTNRGLEEL
ncbi:HAD family hydrolase [Gracilinema caldarium]|uniref:phosphoglycolate phosphatase n=1 Tax=Gracilinema caldarium (strain ATCC 51460 / DSM 7334 / H1) TaxID=744872 RepID=F8EWV5_GRAC1|nr:HAD family hydrolase [Gracilinema caldarium]AEJ18341.1 Haloacid dehalogenase domain protein hydrolase [Gracilinema caldarium DSM 7334]